VSGRLALELPGNQHGTHAVQLAVLPQQDDPIELGEGSRPRADELVVPGNRVAQRVLGTGEGYIQRPLPVGSPVERVPQVQVAGHEPLQRFFRVIQLVQPRRGGRDDGKPEIHADEESIGGCHPGREVGVGAFRWLVGVRHGAGV